MTFADIIAPLDEAEFFAAYHDRRPLHIPAPDPARFQAVMSWAILTQILNMSAHWSQHTLSLVLDKQIIAAAEYCREVLDSGAEPKLQPDAGLVTGWLQRGASLVANDIDTLSPGLAATANALEARLGAKVQANLYCSTHRHQAFDSHFDTHEVFALHMEGEKVWRVYEGRLDQPIASTAFQTLSQDFIDANKGPVLLEVTMRPGDVLYIPRGQYHDAVATGDNALHVAFGATHPIGIDVVNLVLARAMEDPVFRANLPLQSTGDDALRAHLDILGSRLAEMAAGDGLFNDVSQARRSIGYQRGGYDLPADTQPDRYNLCAAGLSVASHAGQPVLISGKRAIAIPDGLETMVGWMLGRPQFSRGELDLAFAASDPAQRQRALTAMTAMKVIAPAP